ncbi:MAG: ribonuclease P protein component [Candidatus Desulfatibia sp.]|uniref:ribonuclease P protein component n=1 Tax=Candidatus Desulfatibia sp. TaxID=3101189 RepID=UPI002F347247
MTGKKGFDAVFSGRRLATSDLVFYFIRNSRDCGRLGMAIGKAAHPRAVDRNRLKRRIRDIFRHMGGIVKGYDVVAVAKKGRRLPEYGELEGQFEKLAKAVKALSG